MMHNLYLFFNNKLYHNTEPILVADNKGFRYGVLVFETMRFANNEILFFAAHYARLEKAANLLQLYFPKYFTEAILKLHIEKLLQKNQLTQARIRVTISKGGGGLFENDADAFNLLIETYPLESPIYTLNSNGLDICFFDQIKKTTDQFSNYKTGNHLLYNMAAQYAKSQKCNEAFIYNTHDHICDSTISNVFILKNNTLFTPPLTDGCIDGIMRDYIIQQLKDVQEVSLTKQTILDADEVFVTNTIRGIQWVKSIENKSYSCNSIPQIFEKIIAPLHQQ